MRVIPFPTIGREVPFQKERDFVPITDLVAKNVLVRKIIVGVGVTTILVYIAVQLL